MIKKNLNAKLNILSKTKKSLLNDYISIMFSEYEMEYLEESLFLANLLSFINFTEVSNDTVKNNLKMELINQLQVGYIGKNFSKIQTIYLNKAFKFGNSMILLNNILYYSEILNISKIYLNSDMNWPLKNNVTLDGINITLISPSNIDFINENIISFNPILVYSQRVIRPEIRINKLKNEIFKNLPKIHIDTNDLYIHIRGGDIFNCKKCKDKNYSQPPLCFYQKIITNFKFKNIYIISEDKRNPIITPLINQFNKIILTQNLIQTDIAIISNAYNLVGSMSSFLISLVIINENLKNFWEYDNYRLTEKYLHLHPQIYENEIK